MSRVLNAPSSPPSLLALHTLAHPLVDACSMGVLVAGGLTLPRALAYNAIAFALQLPAGMLADARPRLAKAMFFAGTLLAAASALAAAFGLRGWLPLAAACFGNALFHLAAGKDILETHGGRPGPIGLFISTGALGLLAGRLGAERCAALALPALSLALATVAAWTALRLRHSSLRSVLRTPALPSPAPLPSWSGFAVAGLFLLVGWRSWAGMTASYLSAGQGTALLFGGAAVTWAGKTAGGYLAGRLGRIPVTAASVCGSAALAFLCPPGFAAAWLALLFVAQLATGPVLSLLHDRCLRRGGLAFGLNCLALFLGGVSA